MTGGAQPAPPSQERQENRSFKWKRGPLEHVQQRGLNIYPLFYLDWMSLLVRISN